MQSRRQDRGLLFIPGGELRFTPLSHILQLHTPVCGLCFRFLHLARDGVCSALWPAWAGPSGPLGLPLVTAGFTLPADATPNPLSCWEGSKPYGDSLLHQKVRGASRGKFKPFSCCTHRAGQTAWRGQSHTDMRTLRCRHGTAAMELGTVTAHLHRGSYLPWASPVPSSQGRSRPTPSISFAAGSRAAQPASGGRLLGKQVVRTAPQ